MVQVGQDKGFEREKWLAEVAFREREIAIKEREQSVKEREQAVKADDHALRRGEQARARWANPLVVAIFAAAVAAIGNSAVALLNGIQQRAVEEVRAESARILEMIKTGTGNEDKAAANLQFLIDSGLIRTPELLLEIRKFLKSRSPGAGPALPAVSSTPPAPVRPGTDWVQLATRMIRCYQDTTLSSEPYPGEWSTWKKSPDGSWAEIIVTTKMSRTREEYVRDIQIAAIRSDPSMAKRVVSRGVV